MSNVDDVGGEERHVCAPLVTNMGHELAVKSKRNNAAKWAEDAKPLLRDKVRIRYIHQRPKERHRETMT